ncbi:MAG: metal-dependent hydrolase [Candidatus Aenigmarchaeota archaeon]|nr:metal-dependent hydrolase [Candidatus Aenigmarchaeota archaeon]
MPFTPFHLGPALFLGLMFFRYLNFPAFLIANVIVDVEPFVVLIFGLDYPLHGFFHSFLGGSLIALVLYLVMVRMYPYVRSVMDIFYVGQEMSRKKIMLSCFSGVYLHIILDSFIYADIMPFFPFDANPFLSLGIGSSLVYSFCVLGFVLGIVLFGVRVFKKEK